MYDFLDAARQTSGFYFPVGESDEKFLICSNIEEISHLLVCGATGTGKSSFVHSILLSLISQNNQNILKVILFDYKSVEFSIYNNDPHLLIPVISDSQKIVRALDWINTEIEKRIRAFSEAGVKDVKSYNDLAWENFWGEIPRILIVIDDFSSLVCQFPKSVNLIMSILQKGRSVGMHLICVTQTPMWKETKKISTQIRSKVVFSAATQTESKNLLGKTGAELIESCGTALFSNNGSTPQKIKTICPKESDFSSILETNGGIKENDATKYVEKDFCELNIENEPVFDELLPEAIKVVAETGMASVSMLQRRLKLGYSRAARLVEQMEEKGIVGPFEGSAPRKVLIDKEAWQKEKCKTEVANCLLPEVNQLNEDIEKKEPEEKQENKKKKESRIIKWLKNEMRLQKEYRDSFRNGGEQ